MPQYFIGFYSRFSWTLLEWCTLGKGKSKFIMISNITLFICILLFGDMLKLKEISTKIQQESSFTCVIVSE